MRKPLQEYRESNYERPQLPWVCGLAAEGICCPLGPTGKGRCREGAACVPVLDGERFVCGRPNAMGGQCDEGPTAEGLCCHTLSCQPVPSQRVQRGRWIAGCLLFTIGLLAAVWASAWRNEILAPGPLTQNHAQIIRREESLQRCATCHPAGNANAWEMCRIGLGLGESLGPPQWSLCLKCHEKTIPQAHALAAHSVPGDVLDSRARPMLADKPTMRKAGFDLPAWSTKRAQLQCSACHREHQGASHSLVEMTNAQCQNCHQQSFVSLAAGHPEFENWPYNAQPQLKFNHRSHAGKHFVEAKQEFACATCHVDDPQKDAKLVAGFEQSCARCHAEKINTSALGGIVLLRLPSLDTDALAAAGEKIEWPAEASGEFDGPIPWGMQLLLAADPEVADALLALGDDVDFANLRAENPEDLAAAAKIARGIRRLFDDLAARGHLAVEERLANSLSAKTSAATQLTQGLSPETLGTLSQWFDKDHSLSAVMSSAAGTTVMAAYAEPDDLLSDDEQKIFYGGKGPQQNEPANEEPSTDEPPQEEPTAEMPPADASAPKEPATTNDDEELLVPEAEQKPVRSAAPNPLRNNPMPPAADDADSLLLDPPTTTPPRSNDTRPSQPPAAEPNQPAEGELLLPDEPTMPLPMPWVIPTDEPPAELPSRFAEQWRLHPLPRGVWFADPLTFTLRYVPRGHGDPVFSAWLEAAVGAVDTPSTAKPQVFDQLLLQATNPQGQGLCFQCHTSQTDAVDGVVQHSIAWHSQALERRGFTRFSHRPHLIQPQLADCTHCHELRSSVALTSYEAKYPTPQATRDFEPIKKQACVHCHTQSAAGDSCTKCHRYHVQLDALRN